METLESRFEMAGGSVVGRAHVQACRNNQDAFTWEVTSKAVVAVVCDGCSGGRHSEVGAKVAARVVSAAMSRRLVAREMDEAVIEEVGCEALEKLGTLASLLGTSREAVGEHLLFTVLGVAVTEKLTCVFGLGDGLYAVNDEVQVLGPFPGNAPPYLGYGLLEGHRGFKLGLHCLVPTREVRSLMIGTDGVGELRAAASRNVPGRLAPVGPLSSFWSEGRYFANPDAVRRRLSLINRDASRVTVTGIVREPGLLSDDTTMVVLRRRPEGGVS